MTYNVFGGTLNIAQPYPLCRVHTLPNNLCGTALYTLLTGHEHPYSIHLHYHRRAVGHTTSLSPVRCGSDSDMRQLLTLDANCNDDTCRFVLRHRNSVQHISFGESPPTLQTDSLIQLPFTVPHMGFGL